MRTASYAWYVAFNVLRRSLRPNRKGIVGSDILYLGKAWLIWIGNIGELIAFQRITIFGLNRDRDQPNTIWSDSSRRSWSSISRIYAMIYFGYKSFQHQMIKKSSTALTSLLGVWEAVAADCVVTLPLEVAVSLEVVLADDKPMTLKWVISATHKFDQYNHFIPYKSRPYLRRPLFLEACSSLLFELTCLVRSMTGTGHFIAITFAIIFLRKVSLGCHHILTFETKVMGVRVGNGNGRGSAMNSQ